MLCTATLFYNLARASGSRCILRHWLKYLDVLAKASRLKRVRGPAGGITAHIRLPLLFL